jgi:hypothetical protein
MAALAKSWRREQVPTARRKGNAHTAGEVRRGIEHSLGSTAAPSWSRRGVRQIAASFARRPPYGQSGRT